MPSNTLPNAPAKYIFLDRDGVINRDSADYIKTWEEFEFLPGSLTALQKLTTAGFRIIVITNQSIVGRRWVKPETLQDIFKRMCTAIEAHGGRVHDVFFCPHTPDDGCNCRKPATGLIEKAARTHRIDVSTTIMVGDSAKDIVCAHKAGCKAAVLVKTGNFETAQTLLKRENLVPDVVAADLLAAATWVLDTEA